MPKHHCKQRSRFIFRHLNLKKKALKRILQNIYLTLDFLYHNRNLLFTTVVDGSIFLIMQGCNLREKNASRKYYFYLFITTMKLNHIYIRRKSFLNYFEPKMILLNISILQDKSNFLRLHSFTKCFSGSRVNQIVNKCLNG